MTHDDIYAAVGVEGAALRPPEGWHLSEIRCQVATLRQPWAVTISRSLSFAYGAGESPQAAMRAACQDACNRFGEVAA